MQMALLNYYQRFLEKELLSINIRYTLSPSIPQSMFRTTLADINQMPLVFDGLLITLSLRSLLPRIRQYKGTGQVGSCRETKHKQKT